MDHNVVERELAERDPGMCVCKGGPTLEILKEIQRLYEERMEQINRASGCNKLQVSFFGIAPSATAELLWV